MSFKYKLQDDDGRLQRAGEFAPGLGELVRTVRDRDERAHAGGELVDLTAIRVGTAEAPRREHPPRPDQLRPLGRLALDAGHGVLQGIEGFKHAVVLRLELIAAECHGGGPLGIAAHVASPSIGLGTKRRLLVLFPPLSVTRHRKPGKRSSNLGKLFRARMLTRERKDAHEHTRIARIRFGKNPIFLTKLSQKSKIPR